MVWDLCGKLAMEDNSKVAYASSIKSLKAISL